jgi:hypothetical protein
MFASQIGQVFSSFNIGQNTATGFLPSTAHACMRQRETPRRFVQFEHFTQCLFISDIRDYVAYFST